MTGLSTELLPQLSLGNAERTARHGRRPDHAGLFCVVEILDEGVGNALLAGRAAGAAVAAILRNQ
jgi:hypothetical protein